MNIPQIPKPRTLMLSALLLTLSLPLSAQDAAPAQTISPEAKAVIDRMSTYLRSLKTFQIESYPSRDEVTALGYKVQNNEHTLVTVSRPNKLRSEVTGDIRNRTYIYDGAKLTIYSPEDKVFARVDAPDSTAKLIGGMLNAGIEMPMIDVLYQANAGTLTEDVRGGAVARRDHDRRRRLRPPRVPAGDHRLAAVGGKRRAPAAAQDPDNHPLRSRRSTVPSNHALEPAA